MTKWTSGGVGSDPNYQQQHLSAQVLIAVTTVDYSYLQVTPPSSDVLKSSDPLKINPLPHRT